ncbi:MAG: hypothetical protein LBI06_08140 [Treponema sp.]|jgi:hypothetical protein|nr:hypothetical protein [Treponema sp.]
MKSKHKNLKAKQEHHIGGVIYTPLFPRPICLERCTMNVPNGYENNILKTLKAFSNKDSYHSKFPHKLEGGETWSIDVKSRNDVYRMLFQIEDRICKITNLCTSETH